MCLPIADSSRLQQTLRLVVDEDDAAVAVSREHALPDPVQDRLALLEQPADLVRLETERLPFDPPSEEERPDGAEQQRERGWDEQDRQVVQ